VASAAARVGATADGHESFELGADEFFVGLADVDLRLRCLVSR